MLVKIQKIDISYYTSCLDGALEGSEAHGPWISQLWKIRLGTGRSG